MEKIKTAKVLFIKLGVGGVFEKDCIEKDNTLRLDYRATDYHLCSEGNWGEVYKYFMEEEKTTPGVATSHTNQIKYFYEEGERTLWITFHSNKLWWCFSKPIISLLPDGTTTRPVIGKWSDKDVNGKELLSGNISGKLLKTRGFRGTICTVPEKEYALRKINGEQSLEAVEVEKAMNELKLKLTHLIKHLQWKDFEALIDLIFRQAGWQRMGELGKQTKSIDLEVLSPVTGERAIVQIKSQCELKEFRNYEKKFAEMEEYDKSFFIVHSPKEDLENFQNDSKIILYFVDKITDLTISSGLVDWLIIKTS
jgi:hypothetical protein